MKSRTRRMLRIRKQRSHARWAGRIAPWGGFCMWMARPPDRNAVSAGALAGTSAPPHCGQTWAVPPDHFQHVVHTLSPTEHLLGQRPGQVGDPVWQRNVPRRRHPGKSLFGGRCGRSAALNPNTPSATGSHASATPMALPAVCAAGGAGHVALSSWCSWRPKMVRRGRSIVEQPSRPRALCRREGRHVRPGPADLRLSFPAPGDSCASAIALSDPTALGAAMRGSLAARCHEPMTHVPRAHAGSSLSGG
jgi:hypothetical protein